jgi:Cytochrome P460
MTASVRSIAVVSLSIVVATAVFAADVAPTQPAARFEGKDSLLRPEGYREWIFVGSSSGLRYDKEDGKPQSEKPEYKNVYIDPASYREYAKTKAFPQGTVFVLESASGETKSEPGLRGSFQKEFVGLIAAVKDRERFADGWAYFRFTETPGKLLDKAKPFAKSACFDCHQQKGAEDNVFTQFYPVLRAISKK